MARSDFIMEVRGYLVNPAEKRLRAPWRIGLWILLAGFGSVVLTLLFTVVPAPTGETGLAAAVYALAELGWGFLAMGVAGLGFGYLLDRRTMADFGLGLDAQWWRDAGFGVALGLGLPTVVLAVELAVGWTAVTAVLPATTGGTFGLGSTGAVVGLALLIPFFVVQATVEEILVRGYLLTNLAEGAAGAVGKTVSTVAATVLTGALFGVLHWTNPSATLLSVTNITLYGFLLGACYVLTDRLGVACGFHVAWNYTLSLWDFPVSGLDTGIALVGTESTGPELITGGAFGPEGGLIALPLLALGAGALYWWVRREYGRVEILDSIAVPDLRIATRGGE
ncbi:CPBP family intramembrane glutamic endopeptidase [Haloarcula onubensis]|uniref:CPBP family intramembrane metalloprotease n=1 Tax=Haloarcula onubensis TaxID=2950539 RepID=A0ABU2FNP2_9EURY|nr:type II CAAX endopeptidase family protein [Halomicroarcula sp. S3CR25-11]MDS0282376.1 CPBP family intramembrane metalloprotease [Halomicroarcula sp. S3CR25-11]